MEKRIGCKNSRVAVLWVFYGPPTLGINCHVGRGGGWGAVVLVEEESDGAAVIYEVIQDSVHWCQRGWKGWGREGVTGVVEIVFPVMGKSAISD